MLNSIVENFSVLSLKERCKSQSCKKNLTQTIKLLDSSSFLRIASSWFFVMWLNVPFTSRNRIVDF